MSGNENSTIGPSGGDWLAVPAASPLLAQPGAVAGQGVDAPVAWHYGDPMAEQRALAAGQAVVDFSHRGVIRITGSQRLSWLHSLTTQQLAELPPHTSTQALILDPKGRIEYDLAVLDDGQVTWLSIEPDATAGALAWLESMRFRMDVQLSDATGQWATLALVPHAPVGPADDNAPSAGVEQDSPGSTAAGLTPSEGRHAASPADAALREALAEVGAQVWHWDDPWPALGPDTASYTDTPLPEHPGWQRPWRLWFVPRDQLAVVVEQLQQAGIRLAGAAAAQALRVAAWQPRVGWESDERATVHELDWLRTAVHLHKGCYRGQETVARVHNLGRPPRRLAFVHLDGSDHELPPAGAQIRPAAGQGSDAAASRPVGHLTTVVRHYEAGPIALALIKRNVDPDAALQVDGHPITVEPIVSPTAGVDAAARRPTIGNRPRLGMTRR